MRHQAEQKHSFFLFFFEVYIFESGDIMGLHDVAYPFLFLYLLS